MPGSLRYLDGGGVGCFNEDDRPTDRRKLFHHFTFYGFLLCFASTSVATLYHYFLGARRLMRGGMRPWFSARSAASGCWWDRLGFWPKGGGATR